MIKRMLVVPAIGAFATWTALAPAGYKSIREVIVTSTSAYGTVGDARASADTTQYIGCNSYGTYGLCAAYDKNGNPLSCHFSTADKAAVVHSIGSYSYLSFTADTSGNCSTIFVSNFSQSTPSAP